MILDIRFNFHPVGQGLFTSGALGNQDTGSQFFWVFDCGTSSKQRFLNDQIEEKAQHYGKHDLLFLSHFDKDHVSGVTRFINKIGARTVVLPYMPLWQRLLIAFDEDLSADDALMAFYRNPAGYLSELENGPDRIIFIGPGAGEGGEPGPVGEPPAGPVDEPDERFDGERSRKELKADIDPNLTQADDETRVDLEAMGNASTAEVEWLKRGGGLYALGLWEFVPYNDPSVAPKADDFCDFVSQVNDASEALVDGNQTVDGKDPVKVLEAIYDEFIDKKNRNKGSLFVYTGPLGRPHMAFPYWVNGDVIIHGDYPRGRCSLLLTGDGDLSDDQAFSVMRRHFGRERMARIEVLQVMHHGAKGNTKPGRANDIAPSFSVFCADPHHGPYFHPDAEVVRDFLRFRPILVDQHQHATFGRRLDWL